MTFAIAMTKDELFTEISQALVELFELDPKDVTLEADLYKDLDIDSIDAIDLLAMLREKSGARLSPEQFRDVRTVGDVIDKIAEQLSA
jgi:acyl carrier protein